MTPAADPIAALRTILLADPDLDTAVNGQVYGGEIPEAESKSMPVAAVVLRPAGGPSTPGGGYQQFGKQRVDVVCYGHTLSESYAIDRLVYPILNAIQRQVADSVLVHSATCEAKAATARDPLKQWPTTYSSWLVLAAEVAAN